MSAFAIITLAIFATVLPLWMGCRYGALLLVSPMHLVGYFCAFGFLVKAVVYPAHPDWAFYRRYIDEPEAALSGAVYLTLFVFAICLGYRLVVGGDRVACRSDINGFMARGLQHPKLLFGLALTIAVLTFVAILQARGVTALTGDVLARLNADKQINVSATGVGATLAGIKSFFIIPKCAFVLLLAHGVSTGDRSTMGQSILLAAVLALIALVSGDRFELVELLAFGSITYLIVGGVIHARALAVAGLAAVAVFALSAYMTQLRGSDAGLLQQLVGSTYFLDINAAIMVTARVTPDLQLWGESYAWWGFGWVPRAFWIDKPAIDLGVYFKRDVMGLWTGGAFNVTGPGEAYINFGGWGVLVGIALGALYRWIEVWLLSPAGVLGGGGFVLYPLVFYPFVQATLQSSFSAFVVGAAAHLVLIGLIIILFVPRYRLTQQREVGYGL